MKELKNSSKNKPIGEKNISKQLEDYSITLDIKDNVIAELQNNLTYNNLLLRQAQNESNKNQTEVSILIEKLHSLNIANGALQDELSIKQKLINKTQFEIKELITTIARLEADLQIFLKQQTDVITKNNFLQGEVSHINALEQQCKLSLIEEKNTTTGLKKELESLVIHSDQKDAIIKELQNSLNKLTFSLKNTDSDLIKATNELSFQVEKMKATEKIITTQIEEKILLQKSIQEKENLLVKKTAELVAQDDKIQSSDHIIQHLTEEKIVFLKSIKEKDILLFNLTEEFKKVNNTFSNIITGLKINEQKLYTELDHKQVSIDSLLEINSNYDREQKKIQDELKRRNEQASSLDKQVKEYEQYLQQSTWQLIMDRFRKTNKG
jgi:hypothetical protein